MATKVKLIALLDVSKSMGDFCTDPHNVEVSSKLAVANTCIKHQVVNQMARSSSEFGLVTFASEAVEIMPLGRVGSSTLRLIHATVKVSDHRNSNLVDGLALALDLMATSKPSKNDYRLLWLLSDCESKVEGEAFDRFESLVEKAMNAQCRIFVSIIGKVSVDTSTVIKVQTAELFRYVAKCTHGSCIEISQVGDFFPLFSHIPGLNTVPRPLSILLQISEQLKIPCQYWAKVSKLSLPSLKKFTKVISPDGGENDIGDAVNRDIRYRDPDMPDFEVPTESRVRGYKYGSQNIPLRDADEELYKIPGDASITVLGFMAMSKIPRHHFLEGTVVLQGMTHLDSSKKAVRALALAMIKTERVALARFVRKKDADPSLIVLWPEESSTWDSGAPKGPRLLIHRLPCSDDVRDFSFPALPVPDSTRVQAVRRFVDALTVQNPTRDQITPFCPTLKTVALAEWKILCSAERCVSEGKVRGDDSSTTASDHVADAPFVDPMTAFFDARSGTLTTLSSSSSTKPPMDTLLDEVYEKFQLAPAVEASMTVSSKRKWADSIAIAGDRKRSDLFGDGIEIQFAAESVPTSMASSDAAGLTAPYHGPPALSTASTAPVDEFMAFVKYCSDCATISSVMDSMTSEIIDQNIETMLVIISNSIAVGTSTYFRKALSCLKALRLGAIALGLSARFNDYLRNSIKVASSGQDKLFFENYVIPDAVSLIVQNSSEPVTASEAEAFLRPEAIDQSSVLVENEDESGANQDDLFADMM